MSRYELQDAVALLERAIPLAEDQGRLWRRIARAHALVHMSRMEGGANVVIEAVRSQVPVLASRIDGNVGLLGRDYDGYFPLGDAAALAALMQRFNVRSVPTLLFFSGGELRDQLVGGAPKQTILEKLSKLSGSPTSA